MNTKLTEKQLEQYGRDGFLFPIDVFSGDQAAVFRNGFESIVEDCGKGSRKRFDSLHLFFDWAYRLVRHDALLDVVEEVLGGDILVYGTLVFYKPPHDPGYAPWHQDSVYSGLHLTPSTSAWIALTPSNQANGCMRVIPETHKLGSLVHDTLKDDPNSLNRRGERVQLAVDESKAVDVVLKPGQASLHQSTIVHGSNPNTSDEPRIGLIVRFVTNRMENSNRPLLRVRGDGDCSHSALAQPPPEMDQQKAFAAWREFSNLQMSEQSA